MDPKKPGNEKMPDFKQLDDRVIAEPTDAPTLVIKTNLDSNDVSEGNPYFEESGKNKQALKDYFKD
ncbi:hypothetical protein ACFYKX_02790 [Cytobacillus sp. FJAT-54145]|uniref:Uncharacterized protein n=1 Tax=Cytobacillus spartinae TaxID=3299023 RepID=A0ABW6K8E2_9BACI